jgi:hypothetical protein
MRPGTRAPLRRVRAECACGCAQPVYGRNTQARYATANCRKRSSERARRRDGNDPRPTIEQQRARIERELATRGDEEE